jgi:hypothetical protein
MKKGQQQPFVDSNKMQAGGTGRYRPRVTPPMAAIPTAVCLGDPDEDSVHMDESTSSIDDEIEDKSEQINSNKLEL